MCVSAYSQISKGGIKPPPSGDDQQPTPSQHPGGGTKIEDINKMEVTVKNFVKSMNVRYSKCYGEKSHYKSLTEIMVQFNYMYTQASPSCDSLASEKKISSDRYNCMLNKKARKDLRSIESDPIIDPYLRDIENITEREIPKYHEDLRLHGKK
jgi:hypothetical protein